MSFTKYPYTVGPWGIIPSAEINQLNNQIQNALDKVGGDTTTGPININGGITINSTMTIPAGQALSVSGTGAEISLSNHATLVSTSTNTITLAGTNTITASSFILAPGGSPTTGATTIITSNFVLNSGLTLTAYSGSTFTIGATVNCEGTTTLVGATTTMTDNTPPQLTSSTTTRNLAQPLVLTTGTTTGGLRGNTFTDVPGSVDYDMMITNLPNGCVITGFNITMITFTAPTSGTATATLYSVNASTGAVSSALASLTVSSSLSNAHTYNLQSSSCSVAVNTATTSYFVRVNASQVGDNALVWCAPIIQTTISNITQLA